ncbi:MAG TPA: serine hydrolase [Candidatus Binatia bacterium]|nr:serine hydrolase [Candidatus Binatia bacterium]
MKRLEQPPYQQPRRAGRTFKRLVTLLVLILIAFSVYRLTYDNSSRVKALPSDKTTASLTSLSSMGSKINSIINANPTVDISVSVIDLTNNQSYNYGLNVPFVAASTSKLITAADFLHQVETGSETLDEQLSGMSASDELRAMIVQSDDNSWQILNDELTDQGLADYASQIGINDFNLDDNTLTSSDIALLLQKLYEGKLLNANDTKLLLSYMKAANYRDYIIPAVPSDVKVYHKAGLLDDRIHDAAIIDNGLHPYVLVIFTNGHGTYDDTKRAQTLQNITKVTVAHFIGQ